jgi:catechol 2,3-dioxygenase-like lactoylglutathione lyase family enzyme
MRIERIDHVQLAMPAGGEDAARRFYSGVLGIPEVPKPLELAVRGGVWFESGPLKIHLGIDPEFHAARKAHPALVVSGLESLIVSLLKAGYAVKEGEGFSDGRHVYVWDPFGNRIELIDPA